VSPPDAVTNSGQNRAKGPVPRRTGRLTASPAAPSTATAHWRRVWPATSAWSGTTRPATPARRRRSSDRRPADRPL